MKNYVIELAKKGNVIVGIDDAQRVVCAANEVGVSAYGGALVERPDGGVDKVVYTTDKFTWWLSKVETLLVNMWVTVDIEDALVFGQVCESLGIIVCGGALIGQTDGTLLKGFYL